MVNLVAKARDRKSGEQRETERNRKTGRQEGIEMERPKNKETATEK